MNIDFAVRKAVARWCRDVALEDVGTANHAERVNIARALVTTISPATPEQDLHLPQIVHLVRTFAGEDAGGEAVDAAVAQILAVYVKLGALQS